MQQNIIAQVDIGGRFFGGGSVFLQTSGVGKLVSLITEAFIVVGGIIILYFIVLAGFKMIQSAGTDNPKGAEQARMAMTNAVIGFVIMFTAYWIIQVIERIVGVDFITI